MLETHEVLRDRAGFSRKNFLPQKLGKWAKKWAKNGVFLIY